MYIYMYIYTMDTFMHFLIYNPVFLIANLINTL